MQIADTKPSDDDDAADQASTWPRETERDGSLSQLASRFRLLDHSAPRLVGQLSWSELMRPTGWGWGCITSCGQVASRSGQHENKWRPVG